MKMRRDPLEARKLAIVATNFTLVLGYLALAVGAWNPARVFAFSAGILAIGYYWHAAFQSYRRQRREASRPRSRAYDVAKYLRLPGVSGGPNDP